jgi:hypothetical protein
VVRLRLHPLVAPRQANTGDRQEIDERYAYLIVYYFGTVCASGLKCPVAQRPLLPIFSIGLF